MKYNTVVSGLIVFFISIILTACVQIGYTPPDYSRQDVIRQQIKKAETSLSKDPLETVYRMMLLKKSGASEAGIEALLDRGLLACEQRFKVAVQKKNWTVALCYFRSLEALSKTPLGWSVQKLQEKQQKSFYETQSSKQSLALNIPQDAEQVILGTATVLVDKGLSIQKGVGYADQVIGSGFFIDKQGYFITNYHVIESEVNPEYEGYSRLYIKTAGKPNTKIPAKVVGWDPLLDLALLKVPVRPDFVFSLGSSENLKIGSQVYAIGSPAGLESTLTAGILSGKNNELLFHGTVLQIDAAINPGSSGGPVIDNKGFVQAVAFAGLQQFEGLNFAIPVELLKKILPRLYAGGKVEHSWLGCFGTPQERTKNSVDQENATGVEVLYTVPLSAAYYGLVSGGDRILSCNGVRVDSVDTLKTQLFKMTPNTIVRFEIASQKEKQHTFRFIKLEARPLQPLKSVYNHDNLKNAFMPLFGAKLLNTGSRNAYRISRILEGSFAHETGFSLEDYIELGALEFKPEQEMLHTQIYTKRRKSGYVGTFMVLYSHLDNRRFF